MKKYYFNLISIIALVPVTAYIDSLWGMNAAGGFVKLVVLIAGIKIVKKKGEKIPAKLFLIPFALVFATVIVGNMAAFLVHTLEPNLTILRSVAYGLTGFLILTFTKWKIEKSKSQGKKFKNSDRSI